MKEFLDRAAEAYYAGKPFISDTEFDRLAALAGYHSVGTPTKSTAKEHYFRMYSLQKVYDDEPEKLPTNLDMYVKTPKLDGTAVSLLYVKGKLVQALTRGDGVRSEKDLTEKFQAWKQTPSYINMSKELFQVTGEVVASKEISNSRNYAAGALHLKEVSAFLEKEVNFVAYDVQTSSCHYSTYLEKLSSLKGLGFRTVLDPTLEDSFPTDGEVYRLNSEEGFQSLGFTAHHPRGAFALKTRKRGVATTLENVIWQVGKSGKVSPVAVLSPVMIDGAKVSRATLHNMKYIDSLGLKIGDTVEVIRAGDIIPRVVCRV